MAITTVGPNRQITLPKTIFLSLQLTVGDKLELRLRNGEALLRPRRPAKKIAKPARKREIKLSPAEQKTLQAAKKKIAVIQKDLRRAKGLTEAEADVAAKAGLIARDQRWWWREHWQKGEREVEEEITQGKLSKPFQNAKELIAHLHRQKA